MLPDTSSAFNSAAIPSQPSHETSGGGAPPVTPSQQVASHAPGMNGPAPPASVSQAVHGQTHAADMQRDGHRSDQANHYTRSQSPSAINRIEALAKVFMKAKQQEQPEKTREQTKNNEQDKDRDHER